MRIGALRVWFTNAVQQSTSTARRIGTMIGRKIREATGSIDRGVGVGDDESEFGGGRNRAWITEMVEDAKKKLLALLEKSFFERFPTFRRAMRRLLGTAAPVEAPKLLPKRAGPIKLGAHTPDAGAVDEFKQQIRKRMMDAHTREHAGLRDRLESRKKSSSEGDSEV